MTIINIVIFAILQYRKVATFKTKKKTKNKKNNNY